MKKPQGDAEQRNNEKAEPSVGWPLSDFDPIPGFSQLAVFQDPKSLCLDWVGLLGRVYMSALVNNHPRLEVDLKVRVGTRQIRFQFINVHALNEPRFSRRTSINKSPIREHPS